MTCSTRVRPAPKPIWIAAACSPQVSTPTRVAVGMSPASDTAVMNFAIRASARAGETWPRSISQRRFISMPSAANALASGAGIEMLEGDVAGILADGASGGGGCGGRDWESALRSAAKLV